MNNLKGIVKNVKTSSCIVLVTRFEFLWNLNFLNTFSKKSLMSNFIKISPIVAELFHVDKPTDRHDEANSRISQFHERA
jgi:hypothetical protein